MCDFFLRSHRIWTTGPVVQREPFEAVWSERKVMLIGIGDSVTAGLGAASQDHTYFNRLIRNPRDEYAAMQDSAFRKSCLISNRITLPFPVRRPTSSSRNRRETASAWRRCFRRGCHDDGGNDLIHSYGRMPPKECAMYGCDARALSRGSKRSASA